MDLLIDFLIRRFITEAQAPFVLSDVKEVQETRSTPINSDQVVLEIDLALKDNRLARVQGAYDGSLDMISDAMGAFIS